MKALDDPKLVRAYVNFGICLLHEYLIFYFKFHFIFQHVNKTEITMGQNSSMLKVDVFSPEEVQRLEKRFHKLDLDRSGSISIGEFVSVPELKENPLVKRVVEIFDSDLDGEVDFKGEFFSQPHPHSEFRL